MGCVLFAEAKEDRGRMREARLKTPERVSAEVLIVSAGQNVERLLEIGVGGREG